MRSTANSRTKGGIRFTPDPGTVAFWGDERHTALVVNESFGGVGVILQLALEPKVGDRVLVQVGKLSAMVGEIRWKRLLDKNVWRLGVRFTEG